MVGKQPLGRPDNAAAYTVPGADGKAGPDGIGIAIVVMVVVVMNLLLLLRNSCISNPCGIGGEFIVMIHRVVFVLWCRLRTELVVGVVNTGIESHLRNVVLVVTVAVAVAVACIVKSNLPKKNAQKFFL